MSELKSKSNLFTPSPEVQPLDHAVLIQKNMNDWLN